MSNTSSNLMATSSISIRDLKDQYLELISNGFSEQVALQQLQLSKAIYLRLLLDDADFARDIEEARKSRAEVWVSKIAATAEHVYDKEDIPGQRLVFDKLMYLAKADNPDRYGANKKSLDIKMDLGQFKLLPPDEALKSLAADPFALEAEFTEVPESNDEDLL